MRTLVVVAWLAACATACARRDPPPVAPAPPLPADPDVALRPMQEECDAMVAALTGYRACPNLDTDDVADLDAWIEKAERDFAASRKANPEPNAQKAIAAACHKATLSVQAAAARCALGRKPPKDYED